MGFVYGKRFNAEAMVVSLNPPLEQETVRVVVLPGVLEQVHEPVGIPDGFTVQLICDIAAKDVRDESQHVVLSLT